LPPAGADDLADGNCLFDAERGSGAAKEAAAATLSVRKADEYLNAPGVQRDRLYRKGLIIPRIKAGDHGAADKFVPEDLDAFQARLIDGALPVDIAVAGQANISDTAKLAFCMSKEVVRLILDGKLARKWHPTSERGYEAAKLSHSQEAGHVPAGDNFPSPSRSGQRALQASAIHCLMVLRMVGRLVDGGVSRSNTVLDLPGNRHFRRSIFFPSRKPPHGRARPLPRAAEQSSRFCFEIT
jgi:hypothetical protein